MPLLPDRATIESIEKNIQTAAPEATIPPAALSTPPWPRFDLAPSSALPEGLQDATASGMSPACRAPSSFRAQALQAVGQVGQELLLAGDDGEQFVLAFPELVEGNLFDPGSSVVLRQRENLARTGPSRLSSKTSPLRPRRGT